MILLNGRKVQQLVEWESGLTVLDLALKHGVDWGFACTRGTCARCRCLVTEGQAHTLEPTDAEWDRLEPEEIEAGYRLGCQMAIKEDGSITITHKPYF